MNSISTLVVRDFVMYWCPASGSLLKTHRLPPTHSVEPLSNQSCRLPEFINFCITLYKIFRCERSPYLLDYGENRRIIVLPYMASLVAKKKGNHLYYYVVESARVDGQPRIVHQAYLGRDRKSVV